MNNIFFRRNSRRSTEKSTRGPFLTEMNEGNETYMKDSPKTPFNEKFFIEKRELDQGVIDNQQVKLQI